MHAYAYTAALCEDLSLTSADGNRLLIPQRWWLDLPDARRSATVRFPWQLHVLGTVSHQPSETSSKPTFSENLILHFSVSVCWTDLIALDRLLALFAHRYLCFSSISFCFNYSYVTQTKLASSPVNFWAHYKIAIN